MTSAPTLALRDRLARLDTDQIAKLVTGLQQRIDALRAEATVRPQVAVVGIGCRFPGAPDVAAFRRLLNDGRNAVAEPPLDRPERANMLPGGYLDAIDRFDAAFFAMRDSEAAYMDPQHRLVLEVAWHALEDAGAANPQRRPKATGIFLGISTHDYEARFHALGFTPQATTGTAASAAAGRLAHLLDVTGPAMVVDTACSSSLVAVHAACRSLCLGECDLAIAGGVNLLVGDDLTRGFAAAGMLSPSHACRTFDAAADGYVRGEGAGFVILRRLADAERDGDRVRAIVRGGAVNHDGRASSLTAPNASAQTALIRSALADAGLTPADVQVVECHGTGTPLGDPIEVQALAEAYGTGRTAPLLLGAVKSNIGHLEAAAGIAGLIKAILALEAASLPPTLHQAAPNPRIAWDKLPVRVVNHVQPWPAAAERRIGISSFGFSGTNAHIILEAAAPRAAAESRGPLVMPLAAPDDAGLNRLAGTVADWIAAGGAPRPAAASLAIGRNHFATRAAVVADDASGLVTGLRAIASGAAPTPGARGMAPPVAPKVAFLFTGQGSQWAGMARDLYEDDAAFRNAIDRCAGIVDPLIGRSLTATMFATDAADTLSDTRLAQPALFALGYALSERLAAWGVVPDIVIGHSLGEWIAACRAGVFALDDALRLVVARGRLMAEASTDGAMAAVFAAPEVLSNLPAPLRDSVDLAAVNAPDECVVSGPAAAIAAVCDALERQGIGTRPLRTAHAFHSRLMEPALAAFDAALASATLAKPTVALVSNLTGGCDAPFDSRSYWVRHIREPVRFADGMATVAAAGATVLIEIGASPNLIGTASRNPAFADKAPVLVPTLRRNQPARHTLGTLLAQLFVAGVPLRWSELYAPTERGEVPGYPFADRRHWVAAAPTTVTALAAPVSQSTSAAEVALPIAANDEPSTDLRRDVSALLARSLQLAPADAQSDRGFVELGVDSLALTEAVAAVERRWGISIPRRALFESLNTPSRLIAHVAATGAQAASPSTVQPQAASPAAPAPVAVASSAAAAPPPLEAAPGLAPFLQAYVARSQASRDQRRRYGQHLADSRAVAGFRRETKGMLYPIVGDRGTGSHLTDVDGNSYVDIAMGFGVLLFGHNPPFVADAVARHMAQRGIFLGPQAPLAGEVAERICRLTGNARAAFCNSGTEAVMTALRLARHATGRQRVAVFQGSYHGHFDGTLAQIGPGGVSVPLAGGTPPGTVADLLILDYGDEEGSIETLMREGETLAAVLVEPVQGRRPDRQPREFLQRLREVTRAIGAALIFDEVLLGFRVALGGVQSWADVRADLATYGKIIGGGLPIGVVAGEARFLDALDGGAWPLEGAGGPKEERTFFAGTFNKNPLTMTVAQAVLSHLETAGPSLQQTLNARTAAFAARLEAVLAEEEANIRVHNFASLFRFVGASDLFYNHLIRNGVYVWEGRTCFLSTAHDDADLDRIVEAVRTSAREMRAGGMLAPLRQAAAAAGPEQLPTTAGQSALRLLAAFSPETSAAYNQSLVFDFSGPLDVEAMQTAIRRIVERHEALRTTFPDDGATQLVHAHLAPDIRVLDRTGDDEPALQAWLQNAALTPLALDRGPMLLAWIVRLAPEHHRLVVVMPHLVTDGWSMQVIALELAELYSAAQEGRAPKLPEPIPYRRYLMHTRAGAERPEVAAYWRSLYATVPPRLDLPTDRPRPQLQTYSGARASRRLPRRLREALEARGRQAGCTLFSLSLAAYGRLLSQISGLDEAVVAIFSAGQPEVAASALVGYCVGVLPLRIAAGSAVSDRDLLPAVQRAVGEATAHRDYPFARLLKDLNLRRDPSRPPLAAVSFNLDRADALPQFAGLATAIDSNLHGAVRWELNWNIQSDADGLRIDAYYNCDLFDAERVEGWLDRYAGILEALAGGSTSAAIEGPETIASRVARFAAISPAAVAVRDCHGTLDYARLDAQAASLARRLAQEGVTAGDRVAFRLERGRGPVVTMLAAARLGAAFVPLDAEHPDSHHAYIIEDSGARVLVVDPDAEPAPFALPTLTWSQDGEGDASAASAVRTVAERDVAYVLYTSGSTGRPKGVRVSYGAVAHYVTAMLERLGASGPTSFAIVSSFAADLGYTAVLGALWSGGALNAVDAETARDPTALQRWMSETPVDALKIVPPHLAALLEAPGAVSLLPRRALIFGGDVLTWRLVDRIRALGASCRVFNHYGPTETTIGACMTEAADSLRETGTTAVPIGPALSGYKVTIVDPDGQPVADGEEGEIVIAGPAVANGYTRPEAAGQERFGRAPDGERFYRTGDVGRRRSDGAVTFLGRRDDMVKIRGHRIEPAGLAELLRSHPGVRDAAVLVERQDGREPTLLAAVAGDVAPDGMTAWLAQHVPAAMVPARIIVCAVLPLTTNGKVDRQALLASAPSVAGAAPAKAADTVASSTSGEDRRLAIVCDLWRAVLQRDDVGPDDDFFALGGDSIMAIQIVGRARAAGLGLTPTQVFLAPTPRGLAQLAVAVGGNVNGAEPVSEPVPLTPVQRWFLETPLPHRSRWCLSAVFAAPFVVTAARLKAAIEAIVARHDALRMRWDVQATPPVQRIGAPAVPEVVVVELGGGDSLTAAEDRLADRLMDGLDLAAGRMFAAGAVVLSHEQRAHIVVVAHHGVFDMVSWSIVAEDLEAALTDGAAAVRPASTSWSWWSRELAKRSEHKAAELPYWQEIAGRARSSVAAIPIDHSERANCEGDVREQRLAIARERSEQLLNGLADVFGLRTHEAVLAAVGRGLARWAGSAVLLDVEGHGRHPFDPAIDLSRTVGWFTTRYPIVLSAVASEDPAGWLVETKEMMRRVPDGGMGYGILRYGGRAALAVEPDVSFNFVGELGQFGGRALRFVRAGAGVERAADAARRNLITFDVWLEDGCLNLSCRFAARHDETTVAALMRLIDEEVNRLTAACTASASAVYSPSDFSGMDFSQDELDQLAEQVGGLTKAR